MFTHFCNHDQLSDSFVDWFVKKFCFQSKFYPLVYGAHVALNCPEMVKKTSVGGSDGMVLLTECDTDNSIAWNYHETANIWQFK